MTTTEHKIVIEMHVVKSDKELLKIDVIEKVFLNIPKLTGLGSTFLLYN